MADREEAGEQTAAAGEAAADGGGRGDARGCRQHPGEGARVRFSFLIQCYD